ncbi:MAG: DUF1573 domain-containing protein [Saprospiraceae bacterium]
MKKILMSILMVGFLGVFAFAQSESAPAATSANGGPVMKLDKMEVDYGTIEKNADGVRTVKFTNTGNEPLIIKSARGNCGCTVPTWPREAIMPGESNEIKIKYATNRVGAINKKVTITTNEATDNTHIIAVKGNILPGEDQQGVPQNKTNMLTTPTKNNN